MRMRVEKNSEKTQLLINPGTRCSIPLFRMVKRPLRYRKSDESSMLSKVGDRKIQSARIYFGTGIILV
jgi:hypothetical protein